LLNRAKSREKHKIEVRTDSDNKTIRQIFKAPPRRLEKIQLLPKQEQQVLMNLATEHSFALTIVE